MNKTDSFDNLNKTNNFDNLIDELLKFEVLYRNTKYSPLIKDAIFEYRNRKYEVAKEIFDKIPKVEFLLESLVEKLKGKSVYTTVKKIHDKKIENIWERLKGLTSLVTHACIECEQGNTEYKILLRDLHDAIGKILIQNL